MKKLQRELIKTLIKWELSKHDCCLRLSIDQLMGREKQAASPDIIASDFQNFFVDKTAAVRASTDGASNPTFRPSPVDTVLNVLKPVDLDEVTSLISSLPNKHCRTDPLPTWLLKECTAELAPFIR